MSESEIKRTLQSLLPGTRYSVRARAYNNYNVYSEWSEALEFVTPEDDGVPGPVTAISSSFTSPDLLLSWDAPSLNVDGSACNDIAFYRLEITGYAGVTRVYKSLSESFQLTYATQKKDFNTPIPNPHIVISVVDTANNESTPVSTDPLNLAPSQPSAPVVDAIPGALSVVMSSDGVEDFYYFVLQVSQDNSTWSNLYSGADDNYHHAVAGGLTRYYRYKVVDRFGQESIVSDSTSATAISLSGTHSHYLEDLIDVNATPNEGDILYWDGVFWSATPGNGVGSGPSAEYLNDLLDVDTAGVSNGKFLRYNSPNWTAQTASLNDLSDVDTSGVATNKVLKYNGSQWIPQDDNTVSYLNSLLDVDTAGQSIGDVLTFDGYQWVPATPVSGGSGGGGIGTGSSNWTLLDYIMGSSTTGWANVNGSSLTSSGSELSVVGVGGAGSINRYDAKYIPEIAIVEADVRYDSFTGSDAQIAIGFMRRSGYSNSNTVSLYTGPGDGTLPKVYITNWATGVGEGFDAPNPYSTGTWYTLRVVKIGSSFQAYLDGSYIGSVSVSPNNGNDKLGIFAYNANASVRNIKVWQSPIDFLAATPTWPGGGGSSLVYVSTTPPPSPLDGELWWDSSSGALSMWYEHSHVWVEVSGGSGGSGGTGTAYVSPDPPATPASGQFWFDSDTGSTYVYYDSATPSPVWVEVGGVGANPNPKLTAPTLLELWSDYDSVVLADSPIGYWPLSEAEFPARDLAGTNDLSRFGSSLTIPMFSSILTPDGASGAVYTGSNRYSFRGLSSSITQDITIEAWVRWDSTNADLYGQVIAEGDSTGVTGWGIFVSGTGHWALIIKTAGQAWGTDYIDTSTAPVDGLWVHLVGTRKKSSGAMQLWLNGSSIGSGTFTSGNNIDYGTGSLGVQISSKASPPSARGGGYFARCAIYDKVLTSTQIANHYNIGSRLVGQLRDGYGNGSSSDGTGYHVGRYLVTRSGTIVEPGSYVL